MQITTCKSIALFRTLIDKPADVWEEGVIDTSPEALRIGLIASAIGLKVPIPGLYDIDLRSDVMIGLLFAWNIRVSLISGVDASM